MQSNFPPLSAVDISALQEFLRDPRRPDHTFSFHELQGFLFAIASSPETIPPSEWLPMISNEEDLSFESENEAQQALSYIIALYNEVNSAVLKRRNELPAECEFRDDVLANFDEQTSISQWSSGFMIGHDWLSEVWDEYLLEEMDEECGATVMVLSFFSSRQLAEAYFAEGESKRNESRESFEEFAGTVRELFPSALASYAHLGRTIFEVLTEGAAIDEDRH